LRSTSGPPWNRTSPAVGWYTPVTTLNTVVLPAPLGPMRAKIEPVGTARLTRSSATTPPNCMVSSSSSSRSSGTAAHLELVLPEDLGTERPGARPARLGDVFHLGRPLARREQ